MTELETFIEALQLLDRAAPGEPYVQCTQRADGVEIIRWGWDIAVSVLAPGVKMYAGTKPRKSWWKNLQFFIVKEKRIETGEFLNAINFEWTERGIWVDGSFVAEMPESPKCPVGVKDFEPQTHFEADFLVRAERATRPLFEGPLKEQAIKTMELAHRGGDCHVSATDEIRVHSPAEPSLLPDWESHIPKGFIPAAARVFAGQGPVGAWKSLSLSGPVKLVSSTCWVASLDAVFYPRMEVIRNRRWLPGATVDRKMLATELQGFVKESKDARYHLGLETRGDQILYDLDPDFLHSHMVINCRLALEAVKASKSKEIRVILDTDTFGICWFQAGDGDFYLQALDPAKEDR